DLRDRLLAGTELALDWHERHGLVVAEPVHTLHAREARGRLDDARVRDLPAALRVEGALLELCQVPAVRAVEGRDDRLPLGGLVADESRGHSGGAGERQHVL